MTSRISRLLDAHELRVLGCLLEKEQATPDYYPLTVNALAAACSQRSNRTPVMTMSERDVQGALTRLAELGLVRREEHPRATKWRQHIERPWGLGPATKAALTVLMLRGPQTAGEVKSRTSRLHEFASTEAAESALADLASPPDPLVMLLEREPGQKEPRWNHCLAGSAPVRSRPDATPDARPAPTRAAAAAPGIGQDLERMNLRVKRLEQQVQALEAAIEALRGSSY